MNQSDNMIGRQIDRYTIQKVLGMGGMATVYLAWDRDNQWPVALKMMKSAVMSDAHLQERFRREVSAAMKLRHPHLVQVYGSGRAGSNAYMVMEYVDGGSLADLIQRTGRLPDAQAAYLMRRVAGAMAYLHEQGYVHRDLKPHNILMRRGNGEPVVTDLGIISVTGAAKLTGTMQMMGTPRYMAPEQVTSASSADARTDIYAMGLILYEMLSGRVPFDGVDSMALMYQRVSHDPPPVRSVQRGVNPALAAVVDRCLQRDPARRYASAAALAAALDAAMPSTTAPPPVPPPGRSSVVPADYRPRRSVSPWLLLGGLAAALLLIFGLGLVLNGGDRPEGTARTPVTTVAEVDAGGGDGDGEQIGLAAAGDESHTIAVGNSDATAGDGGDFGREGEESEPETAATLLPSATDTPMPIPTATDTLVPTNTPLPPTPLPPTLPPPPTATIPPPPTDTPVPVACAHAVLGDFASAWNRDQLGCPLSGGSVELWMATQSFDGGRMFWREDNDQIYAVYNSGTWVQFADIWREGDPEFSCGQPESPPTPRRGFGKIWCTHGSVRAGLGNARDAESGANGTAQDFERGAIIRTPTGQLFVFFRDNGTWR